MVTSNLQNRFLKWPLNKCHKDLRVFCNFTSMETGDIFSCNCLANTSEWAASTWIVASRLHHWHPTIQPVGYWGTDLLNRLAHETQGKKEFIPRWESSKIEQEYWYAPFWSILCPFKVTDPKRGGHCTVSRLHKFLPTHSTLENFGVQTVNWRSETICN